MIRLYAGDSSVRSNRISTVFNIRARLSYCWRDASSNRAPWLRGSSHDAAHLVAKQVAQRAAQHVEADEGAEVPDVAARIHREAAGVHADTVVRPGGEHFFAAAEGVVEAHRS